MRSTDIRQLIGRQVGSYHITGFIDQGTFGCVFKGTHIHLGTEAAVKLLKPGLCSNLYEKGKFEKEANISFSLRHPHILTAMEFGYYNYTPFFVMPFITGPTLRKRYPAGKRVSVQIALDYMNQLTCAFAYAHDHKIIHRDIKPENIIIDPVFGLLIMDFGIAIAAHSDRSMSIQEIIGTGAYMAPEQFDGRAQITSDIYSLGVVLYELLMGTPPFRPKELGANNMVAYGYLHKRQPVPQMSGIPNTLEQVIRKALEKDPKNRYQRMREFANALTLAQAPMVVDPTVLVLKPGKHPAYTDTVYKGQKSSPEDKTVLDPTILAHPSYGKGYETF